VHEYNLSEFLDHSDLTWVVEYLSETHIIKIDSKKFYYECFPIYKRWISPKADSVHYHLNMNIWLPVKAIAERLLRSSLSRLIFPSASLVLEKFHANSPIECCRWIFGIINLYFEFSMAHRRCTFIDVYLHRYWVRWYSNIYILDIMKIFT